MDQEKEEKLQKENKMMKIALGAMAGVLLVALAVVLFLVVYSGVKPPENISTEPPTTPTLEYSNYTASDEEAAAAAHQVVASVGDKELTNAQLQAFYCMQIYDFVSSNGAYLAYYGLDLTQPLGQQVYNATTGQTWEELFLEQALNTWNRYTVLQIMAEKDNFKMPEEMQQVMDGIPEELKAMAEENEYASVEALVTDRMGAGCTVDGYLNYLYTNYYCNAYFEQLYTSLTPTMDEIEAYYAENEATFVSGGAGMDKGVAIDVRHILLIPSGGESIEGSNYKSYTEDEWAACLAKAQQVLDAYLEGDRSETSFATLAAQHSADGSAANGGLITNILQGKTVENFNNWIFDESRKYGDYDMVRTEYGYHIMFFVEAEEYWIRSVRNMIISNKATEIINNAVEATPMETDLELIKLSHSEV